MRQGGKRINGCYVRKNSEPAILKKPLWKARHIVGVDFSHGVAGRWGPGTRRVLWRSSFQNFRIVLHINARKVSSVWRRNRWCLCDAGERIDNVRPHVDGGWFGWWIHNSRQDVMWIVWRANSQCSIAYGWWMVWKTNWQSSKTVWILDGWRTNWWCSTQSAGWTGDELTPACEMQLIT